MTSLLDYKEVFETAPPLPPRPWTKEGMSWFRDPSESFWPIFSWLKHTKTILANIRINWNILLKPFNTLYLKNLNFLDFYPTWTTALTGDSGFERWFQHQPVEGRTHHGEDAPMARNLATCTASVCQPLPGVLATCQTYQEELFIGDAWAHGAGNLGTGVASQETNNDIIIIRKLHAWKLWQAWKWVTT